MALDPVRNDAYAAALARVVTPDSVVLDLGAGTGVLGLMAARLGARHVYLVEPSDVLCVAEEIVAANSLQDRVTCLRGRLEDRSFAGVERRRRYLRTFAPGYRPSELQPSELTGMILSMYGG